MRRNMDRHKEAKRLRDSGLKYKEIGKSLNVSITRARQLVKIWELKERIAAEERENPSLIPWHRGLNFRTIRELTRAGIHDKETCQLLCGNDLVVRRGKVQVPLKLKWEEWVMKGDRSVHSSGERIEASSPILLKYVNEVRVFFGVEPLAAQERPVTAVMLERAKRLLEKHGYLVEKI